MDQLDSYLVFVAVRRVWLMVELWPASPHAPPITETNLCSYLMSSGRGERGERQRTSSTNSS
jgi:hypothetical protein